MPTFERKLDKDGDYSHAYEMAAEFLQHLDPVAEAFTFQIVPHPEMPSKCRPQVITSTLGQIWRMVLEVNTPECGASIFVTINETDLLGRTAAHIKRVRRLYVDVDSIGAVKRCGLFIAATQFRPSEIVITRPN